MSSEFVRPDANEDEDEKSLIASINDFRESMQNATLKTQERTEEAQEGDKVKIEKARAFAEQTGVDRAICTILRELWHIPPSFEGETLELYRGGETALPGVYCIEQSADDHVTRLYYFDYDDTAYSVSFRYNPAHRKNLRPEAGRVMLKARDDVMCSISIRQIDGLSPSVWVPHEIDHLVVGAWVRHLVEIEEMIKAQRGRFWVRFTSELIQQQAEGLPE